MTRQTEFDRLLATHATRGQAEFFLNSRGQSLNGLERERDSLRAAVDTAKQAVPDDWSMAQVWRSDLDRFLFTRDDIVIAIGQDGLVANLAKYLNGQPVVGVTPDADRTEGELTPLIATALSELLPRVASGEAHLQRRPMVKVALADGRELAALNELFIGHRSHQSARYLLQFGGQEELQSSSGVIVATGTGLTGWARSIMTATHRQAHFAPTEQRAVFFAREPWPSKVTGCGLVFGEFDQTGGLAMISQMNEGGVIFADGIEQDYLHFHWGERALVALTDRTLNLVVG